LYLFSSDYTLGLHTDGKSIPYPHKMSVRGLNVGDIVAGSIFRNFTLLETETVGVIRHLRQPGLQTIIFKSTQIIHQHILSMCCHP